VNPTITDSSAASINPATGATIARYPYADAAALEDILARSQGGFEAWSATSVERRCEVLAAMATRLRGDGELPRLLVAEIGKPVTQARAEVAKAADALEWYASNGSQFLQDQPSSVGPHVRVRHLPLGVVLAVEPWNFPVWQIMRGGIGILLAGNAYLLKPAPNVVGTSRRLEELWLAAGLPAGTFGVLNAEPGIVSSAIADPRIVGVTVTGSVGAGSAIAAQAGRAVKRSVLELGGTDPFIVLADADIDAAVEAAVHARFQNTGQICIAAKRIILERPIAEEFTERFVAAVAALPVGDPSDEDTYIGPVARADLRDGIADQVRRSVAEGARLLHGGEPIDGPGSFFEPTVLSGVRPGMTAFTEEIFGPVASLITAEDADEAVTFANDSEYGLSSSVWTRDLRLAGDIADRLRTGGVFVNKASVSDPRIPIGGVKASGYGRELCGHGVHEFTNIQTLWIETPTNQEQDAI
jgi:succinate-semialdehyde dehydrogenase